MALSFRGSDVTNSINTGAGGTSRGVVVGPGYTVSGPPPPPKPTYQPPTQAPMPAPQARPAAAYGSGGGGGAMQSVQRPSYENDNNLALMMLQQQAAVPPPQPVAPPAETPQEIAALPEPTIFDVGNRVAANPDLGKRNPAMEGLISSFRSRRIY